MSSDKLNVFVSYSHEDEAWLERVEVFLTPLVVRRQARPLGRHAHQDGRALAQ